MFNKESTVKKKRCIYHCIMKQYLLHCVKDNEQEKLLINGEIYQFWRKLPIEMFDADLLDSMR